MKNKLTVNLLIISSLVLLNLRCKDNCEGYKPEDLGTLHITKYGIDFFYSLYKPNQKIVFIRNKVDTFEFISSDYYSKEYFVNSNDGVEACGPTKSMRLENHGIRFNGKGDSYIDFYIQTRYDKVNPYFGEIQPEDTIYFFNFTHCDFERSSRVPCGHLPVRNDGKSALLIFIDSLKVLGKLYDSVYYVATPNPNWGMKEIYYKPKLGIIKFTKYLKDYDLNSIDEFELKP